MEENQKSVYDLAMEEVEKRTQEFFKIKKTGLYRIVCIGEMMLYNKKYPNEPESKQVACINIEYNKKPMVWEFSVGGKSSLFGQISYLGHSWGTLNGKILTIIANNDGVKNSYTIQEYLDLSEKIGKEKEGG